VFARLVLSFLLQSFLKCGTTLSIERRWLLLDSRLFGIFFPISTVPKWITKIKSSEFVVGGSDTCDAIDDVIFLIGRMVN
jgi:hypothetical protein